MNALTLWLLCASVWASPRGVESGVTPPAGLERAYGSRRVALVVGVDVYHDPALGSLAYAAKDAADMAAVLSDPVLGGYDTVSVVSGEVSREAFWSAFRAIASTIQRDDTLLVYVAGHGTLDFGPLGTELYLLASDAWLSDPGSSGILVNSLAEEVAALPARRTVMVLDACYSGTGRSVLAPSVSRKLESLRGPVPSPRALEVSEFSAHLYAAHIHQPSIEDPTLQNGVYTHFFVEALRGAGDIDGDGLVEVMEAHGYARDHTLSFTGGSQVPWAETVSVGREALYLSGDPSLRRVVEDALLVGLEALGDLSVSVDGVARGAGPIAAGKRRIEVSSGDMTLFETTLAVRPGQRIDLAREIAQDRSQWSVSLGTAGAFDRDILGPFRAEASLGLETRQRGSSRAVFRVHSALGPGPVRPTGEGFPAGLLAAGGGGLWMPMRSLPVELEALVGAGFAWRMPARPGPQAAVLLLPGASLRFGRTVFAEMGAQMALFRADRANVALPSGSFAVGLRGSPRTFDRVVTLPKGRQ